jgi:DNA-binding MarR family transcriptional regulator
VDSLALAEALRSFNRFYTEAIGALSDRHEGLSVNLGQSRMLYTIDSLGAPEVSQLAQALQLDLAYTSRTLGTLEDARLVRRTTSKDDRRRRIVRLTTSGQRMLAELERRSNDRMLGLIEHLDESQVGELLESMRRIRSLLTERTEFPCRSATTTSRPRSAP